MKGSWVCFKFFLLSLLYYYKNKRKQESKASHLDFASLAGLHRLRRLAEDFFSAHAQDSQHQELFLLSFRELFHRGLLHQ